MDNSEDNMDVDKIKFDNNPPDKTKPKKRSLVERELETTLTAIITAPLNVGEGASTSRYGRARRLKTNNDFCDTDKAVTYLIKSPEIQSPNLNGQPTSPAYKMQASNSLIHENSPKNVMESNLENQIENIYNTNISLSRFGSEEKNKHSQSPAKKYTKVYMRKDLIQSKEKDDPMVMIKSLFSPAWSIKTTNSHLSNVLERSSDKYDLCKPQNGYLDTSSVVKTLDFDGNKKNKNDSKGGKTVLHSKEIKTILSKSDLFNMEAKCSYQVGDIAWARMGTFPFWPCIVTREPGSDMFVRKKLFGKIERDTIHVTFFGDNGRRSWIADTMLRKYQGLDEFETTRDQFTPEAKKKDPRLYSAFFISDKKLALWHTAIEEADYVQREPKRLRIDLLNELLGWVDTNKNAPSKNQKSSKVTRTDSDVSLSETLYDSLFSEIDAKADESRPKRNKSLDVSEVVTACLDNMAAKTGLTMIQKQSHMDIWLQKAKSKTPEKPQINVSLTVERLDQNNRKPKSKERDNNNSSKKKKKIGPSRESPIHKPYSFRKSTESQHLFSYQNEHDYSKNDDINSTNQADNNASEINLEPVIQFDNSICFIDKVESLRNSEAATKSEDDVKTTESHENGIIVTNEKDASILIDTNEVNDTSSAVCIAMDIDNMNKEIRKSGDVNLKSDNNCNIRENINLAEGIEKDANILIDTNGVNDTSSAVCTAMDIDNMSKEIRKSGDVDLKSDNNCKIRENINLAEGIEIDVSILIDTNEVNDTSNAVCTAMDIDNMNKEIRKSGDVDLKSDNNCKIRKNINLAEGIEKDVSILIDTNEGIEKDVSILIDTNGVNDTSSAVCTAMDIDNMSKEIRKSGDVDLKSDNNCKIRENINLAEGIEIDVSILIDTNEVNDTSSAVCTAMDIDNMNKEIRKSGDVDLKSDNNCKIRENIKLAEGIAEKNPYILTLDTNINNEIEKSEEAYIKSDVNSKSKTIQITEEIAYKNTDVSTLESAAQVAKSPILKDNKPNSLNVDEKKDSKVSKDEDTTKIVSLPNNINDMSIDSEPICQENINTGQNQSETRSVNDQQFDQLREQQNEIKQNECNMNMNMSIDDDVTSFKINQDENESKNKTTVCNKINLQNTLLAQEDKNVIVSNLDSSKSQLLEDGKNTTVISPNSIYKNKETTCTNKEKKMEVTSMKTNQVPTSTNNPKLVPKITLTVIKEANIKSFKITSPKAEQSKRRSLRKVKDKKQEFLPMKEPEFLQYLEMKQDTIMDEHPELNQNEIIEYLYKTWQFRTNAALKQCSGIPKSKSPTDFTAEALDNNIKFDDTSLETKESDATLTEKKVDETKKNTNLQSVTLISETKDTQKRSLRTQKTQLPSVSVKNLEQKRNNELEVPYLVKLKNTIENKRGNKEHSVTDNSIDPNISQTANPEHHASDNHNELSSKDNIGTTEKNIYKVTPKKRSLCLRISKVEPIVVLERNNILNKLIATSTMATEIRNVGSSKPICEKFLMNDDLSKPIGERLPANDDFKTQTDTTEACNTELDSQRSSKRLRKLSLKAKSNLKEKQENNASFIDEIVINRTAEDTLICNLKTAEKTQLVENCHVTKEVDNIKATPSIDSGKKEPEQNEKQPNTENEAQTSNFEIESKRSSKRLRKSKTSLEIVASEGNLEKHILAAGQIDSNSKSIEDNTQIHEKIATENVISKNDNILSETCTELEVPPSKECAKTQQELQEDKSKNISQEASDSKSSLRKIRKSKAFMKILDSKENQENGTPTADEINCKLILRDTKVKNKIEVDYENDDIQTNAESEVSLCKGRISMEPKQKDFNYKISSELNSTILLESQTFTQDTVDYKQNEEMSGEDEVDCKSVEVHTKVDDKIDKNIASVIEDVSSETDTELEIPLSKRRSSIRLRRSQSSSSKFVVKENRSVSDAAADEEAKDNIEEMSLKQMITDEPFLMNSLESKNTNEEDDTISLARNSVDNISLASDLTNGFVDHSSDKDFDPDTVSLSSLSSDISDVSFVPRENKIPLKDKSNVFEKLLDSDYDSVSSLDNVTLSELKTRSNKDRKTSNLRHSLENSMDSIKSDSSERRLRLVLTDCILNDKSNKLPVIKEVCSRADVEFEISQSDSKMSTFKNSSSTCKISAEPTVNGFHDSKPPTPEPSYCAESLIKVEEPLPDPDTISIKSSGSDASTKRRGKNRSEHKPMEEPEFLQYLEMKQDALMDEHPEVTPDEMVAYLYKTWQYEESLKSDMKKNDEFESSNLVKGVNPVTHEPPKKKKVSKQKKLINIEKILAKSPKIDHFMIPKGDEFRERELPKRKASKPFYNEEYSDIEEELKLFEIFKPKKKPIVLKTKDPREGTLSEATKEKLVPETLNDGTATVKNESTTSDPKEAHIDLDEGEEDEIEEYYNEEDLYFEELESFLTSPKPNVFKGLIREKVCEICEKPTKLVKCKGCSGMFHIECVNKEDEIVEMPEEKRRGRKKKKQRGRKPKSSLDSNEASHSDDKPQDLNVSEENMSIEEIEVSEPIVIPDADNFETQLEAKMKEIIETEDITEYDSYSSDDGIDWSETVAGKCEIIDVKLKSRPPSVNTDNFKCKNCQKDDTPICFVCKSPVAPKNNNERRQKCQVAHCHKYYHLECLEHWPQTQFNAGEPSRSNKKIGEHFEAMSCPRHVCHTCVSDDPRGCKTRFSGDKLARCVRCPATYHSFTKCLPAGSQILSASHIVCPRHYEHRPGKIPYHVNTGWCFICALGGNLICCDYCPTSFHADCLNIEPPEGGYMCEDCETGRLPLYGEMVWVKLGHYRWWPGIVLHPSDVPDNLMAVKHSPGEFVVRFFGQYDHYWVNRGRVFPFQEGDTGKISAQKSKIDEAFTKAMEHAQRAFEILKNLEPNDEENQDIQSSLLPPHYVKLKVNKPCGALYGKKIDIEESSLTQCDCNPDEEDPCGPYSHCLNRMLLTECGPICRAGERCQNRAFEKRLYPKMVPYRTPHRGWGLKTLEPIKAGQFVIEYVGELIDETEFRRRMQRKHETRDENFYFLTLDKERLIDAGPKGNLARFMNHCCEPNCETQKWTVLGDVRVGLFALTDIPANTEVTFNYNLECTGIEKKQCMCGAKRCAGYIGAKPKQEEPKKQAAKRTYKKRKNTIESPKPNKPKRPVGRPAKPRESAEKPRELTEIEKDLLIIKNATNGISSDSECSGRLSSVDKDLDNRKNIINETKAMKRKVSFSTEEKMYDDCNSPSAKRIKIENSKMCEVND